MVEAVIAYAQSCYLWWLVKSSLPHALRSQSKSQQWLGEMKYEKKRGHRYDGITAVLILC